MKFLPRFCFVLAFVLFPGMSARAQQIPQFSGTDIKTVPDYARARIPAGGKTRFYGTDRLGAPRNEEVRLHFYQWPQQNPPPDDGSGRRYQSDQNYRVDVFVRKLQKNAQFHLVQSIDIPSTVFDEQRFLFDSVQFAARWLMPKAHKTPLLHLRCTIYNSFYGPFGADMLMIFPHGWSVAPIFQHFEFYGDHSTSIYPDFSTLDETGTLQIKREGTQSGVEVNSTTIWKWNGQKFVPGKTTLSGADAPPQK